MLGDVAALRFRVLGQLAVLAGGRPVRLSAGKLHVMLAALLVNANQVVTIDQLADALWGADPPAEARRTVQVYAVRLRRALGDDASAPRLVHTHPDGYSIEVAPDALDLTAFQRLRAEAAAADAAGRHATAADLLAEALELWRGPALSGLRSDALQRDVVPRLAEERLLAIEHRVDLQLRLGRHREVVAELVRLTGEHPWREELWAQLVTALHRCGRQADAHAAYRKVRDLLRAELGVDPGERLRRAHQALLADAEPEQAAAPPPNPAPVSQLPLGVRRFVGRAEHIARLTELLTADAVTPVVAISGPPGVGKTALALHVAHRLRDRFPDGQLYLNLRGFSAEPPVCACSALTRFLGDLGVPTGQQPVDVEDRAALFRSLLAGRRFLVVLDNAHHPDQVRPLLPATPGCAVLVTSRDDLRGLAATHDVDHLPVGVLTEAESAGVLADLLGGRAEPAAVAELARSCAYLPLALRIAGANLAASPHRPVADYTAELARHGRVAGLAVDGDEQSAVRTAFDLSYLRLLPADQALFRLLGAVLPSAEFRVATAAAAADRPAPDTVRALDRLARANLLQQPAAGAYQFHDLIREYAGDRGRAEDGAGTAAAAARLLDFYLRSAAAATRRLYPGVPLRVPLPAAGPAAEFATEADALRWLDEERQNLLAVAVAGDPRGWQLIDVLRGYLQARGHAVQAIAACEEVLAAAEAAGDRRAQASVLDVLGLVSFNASDYDLAISAHERALRIARQAGDLDAEANCLHNIGRVHAQLGKPDLAMRAHSDALAVSERTGDQDAIALALNYVGVAHLSFGDAHLAIGWHERALALSRATGNRPTTARALNGLGLAYWTLGRLDRSIAHHQQSLDLTRELGFRYGEAVELVCLAEAHCDAGRLDLADELAGEAVARSREIGERRMEAGGLEIAAAVALRCGRLDEAVSGYQRVLRLATEISFGYGAVSSRIGLARALRERGDAATALVHARRAWTSVRASGMLVLEGPALTEIAHAYLDLGALDQAGQHARRAREVTERADHRLALARALHVLGLVERAAGDCCSALTRWRGALDLFAAAGAPETASLSRLVDDLLSEADRAMPSAG
ncbi:BTAD domain-containing putative transcriptional regulator [Actinokineospora sp. NPDC004072]